MCTLTPSHNPLLFALMCLVTSLLTGAAAQAQSHPVSMCWWMEEDTPGVWLYDFRLEQTDIFSGEVNWIVFGDVGGLAPVNAGSPGRATLVGPAPAPFLDVTASVGAHTGPTLFNSSSTGLPGWEPTGIGDFISWTITATNPIQPDGLFWSNLIGDSPRANFELGTMDCGCVFRDGPDADFDGVSDDCDLCPAVPDPSQSDIDEDGVGDLCDNCIDIANAEQEDADADGFGDSCDLCPDDINNDADGDGSCASEGDCDDNNPEVYFGALEACDGLDSDCDGELPLDEDDIDDDGFAWCEGDCDIHDDDIHPDANESCDEVDNDCDGNVDEGCDLQTVTAEGCSCHNTADVPGGAYAPAALLLLGLVGRRRRRT